MNQQHLIRPSNLLLVLTGLGCAFLAALWIALLSLPHVLVYPIFRPQKALEEDALKSLRMENDEGKVKV